MVDKAINLISSEKSDQGVDISIFEQAEEVPSVHNYRLLQKFKNQIYER